jgi:Mrp family chromosome partitioning ATPase
MQTGHAADVSQIVASPLIVSLREQQATAIQSEAELETRYGARNPKLIAAQSQKRDLDAKIAQEVDRLAGSAANDVAVARAQVASLQGSLRQTESESTDQNLARVKLKALESTAVSTRSIYEAFVSRLREAQDQDSIQAPDVHVISHAAVPSVPSSPPKLLIALAAIPISLLLGLLAGLLAERFDVPVVVARVPQRRPAVVPLRGVPVMAELPNALALRAADRVVDQPLGHFGLQMRALAQQIGASGHGIPPKVIAVTSAAPQEGKTTVALALARAAAQLGQRVVVIDGALQAPAIAMMAGLGAPQAGLLEALRGTVPLSGALARDTRSGAFILSPAQRFADPRRVWASPEMAGLMAHLRQYADLVIVDAGPLSTAAAPIITALADAVLVAARWNGAPSPGLDFALATLKSQNRPTGVVLTS